MKRSRLIEKRIISILRKQEVGAETADVCRMRRRAWLTSARALS